jgi:hypothetical protein
MNEQTKRLADGEHRLTQRAYQKGDPLPATGSLCFVSGANQDIESDQHRSYAWRKVIGYSDGGKFIILQRGDSWPTIERITNCWFGDIPSPVAAHDAQPDEANTLDLMRDEFQRIRALNPSSEIMGICERAVSGITQRVSVIQQRDQAERERATLQARLAELVENAFIAGAESVDDRISYDYALQRWVSSDMKRDLETGTI